MSVTLSSYLHLPFTNSYQPNPPFASIHAAAPCRALPADLRGVFGYAFRMDNLWLIKIGEIALKKGNRPYFERILRENLKNKMRLFADARPEAAPPSDTAAPSDSAAPSAKHSPGKIINRSRRFYMETSLPPEDSIRILGTTAGIVGFSRAVRTAKTAEAVHQAALQMTREYIQNLKKHGQTPEAPSPNPAPAHARPLTFKYEIRRTDKSLPLDSYGYARVLGQMLTDHLPQLRVDVHNPDFVIKVEFREWAYVYQQQLPGMGGLPVGSAGRGMLLLSGGIDSPVAGFLMAKRGLRLSAVHFHTPPFTSEEAHDKVRRLAALLAPWCDGLTLHSVPFTDCQVKINQSVKPETTTLHTRACMTQIAEMLAAQCNCGALITGEALGQVASQTLESLAYTDSATSIPVFRPLIGMDKEEIITLARQTGTFETAIEPFDDCCTIFSPAHPLTRPSIPVEQAVYRGIKGLEPLMKQALQNIQTTRFNALGRPV